MSTRELLRNAAYVVQRVIGVPDYDRYADHMREHHPDLEPVSREEFMRQRLVDRYSKPGARCC